jgi:Ca2+-binding RTX toxin-like protein
MTLLKSHKLLPWQLPGILVLACLSSASYAVSQCDNATPIAINKTTGLLTLPPGGHQFYEIKTPSAGLLTLYSLGATDTTGQLYDKDCLVINDSVDYFDGPDNNFQVSQQVGKGTYYLEVWGNTGNVQGDYKIHVEGDLLTADDHGMSCSTATTVRNGVEPGILGPYDDLDFFQVKVDGAGHLVVETEGGTDTTGRLYDSNCLYVNGSVDYFNGLDSNFKIDRVVSPGIYFVEVSGNNRDTKGKYDLRVSGDVAFPSGTCAGKPATQSGTNGSDVIRGTAGNDVIQSFGGDDVILGLEGNDLICGGDGNDIIQGSAGNDRLLGEAGDDVLQSGKGNDALNGGSGTDVCDGGVQDDADKNCEVTNSIP